MGYNNHCVWTVCGNSFFFSAANFKGDEATEIRYSGAATVGFPYGLSFSLSSYTLILTLTQTGLGCVCKKKKSPGDETKKKGEKTVIVFFYLTKCIPNVLMYVMQAYTF